MNLRIFLFMISGIIGSGIFFTPFNLQAFGINSLFSFLGMGAIVACFGYLFSKIGGLSIVQFIQKNLGYNIGFFSSWMYWIVSWMCTIITIGEMFRYFVQMFPFFNQYQSLTKISITSILIIINCFKNRFSKTIEITVNILKIILLIACPLICILSSKFNLHNLSGVIEPKSVLDGFPQVLWCFAGVEIAAIVGKKEKIGSTIIIAALFVCFLYIINITGIFGIMGYKLSSLTPYSDCMSVILGEKGRIFFSFVVFIITLGAINTWIISNGEDAVDNSRVGYFPEFLQKTNKSGANYLAIIMSSIGLIPLCLFEANEVLENGVIMASNGLLIFNIIFCLAYFKQTKSIISLILCICFVGFFIYFTTFICFLLILGVCVLGLPFYIIFRIKNKNSD